MEKKHSWNWIEPFEKNCMGCGTKFLTKKRTKKYCTQSCWTSHNNRIDSIEVRKKRAESVKKSQSTAEYKERMKNNPKILEARKMNSLRMKRLISEGKFTPCITNSWTRWKSYVNINEEVKKFRSSWEAVFYLLNQNLQYEKIRIPYVYNGTSYNYIIDFEDSENKVLYEIKPDSLKGSFKNVAKIDAALDWCKNNNYRFIIISDNWFIEKAHKIDYQKNSHLKPLMRQFLK